MFLTSYSTELETAISQAILTESLAKVTSIRPFSTTSSILALNPLCSAIFLIKVCKYRCSLTSSFSLKFSRYSWLFSLISIFTSGIFSSCSGSFSCMTFVGSSKTDNRLFKSSSIFEIRLEYLILEFSMIIPLFSSPSICFNGFVLKEKSSVFFPTLTIASPIFKFCKSLLSKYKKPDSNFLASKSPNLKQIRIFEFERTELPINVSLI